MRSLIRAAPVCAAALSTLLASGRASAEPPRFELEPKVGYAAPFTTGLSPYGAFVGLGVRARAVAHLWLSTSLFSFAGASAAADGDGVAYRAHDRSYGLAFDATWRFDVGPCFLEPGAEVGAAWVLGSTYVTPAQISDRYVAGNVGPVLRAAVRVGRLALGVEVAALYVPSSVAAPVARAGAIAVLPF